MPTRLGRYPSALAAPALLTATALALALTPLRDASACGCFISTETVVDQTTEQILYVVDGRGNSTAYIQIQYEGGVEDFGWILPVPGLPTSVNVADEAIFADLDAATAPQIYYSNGSGGGFGVPFACYARSASGGDFGSSEVIVWSSDRIGPYETVTLSGTSGGPVVDWLVANDYYVPPGTAPLLDTYVDQGFYFVALRLLPDAKIEAIQPVAVSYSGAMPCVPLRLTAAGAVEDMGLLVYVAASERYVPSNWESFVIDDELLEAYPDGTTNYGTLVSIGADAVGGRAFVTEYAGPAAGLGLGAAASDVLPPNAFLTRLYTKISPLEMTSDPILIPGGLDVVSNQHFATFVEPSKAGFNASYFVLVALAVLFGVSRLALRRARNR